jgi:conserved hypothetical protein
VVQVLCLSNGHGEDRIAGFIARELIQLGISTEALPLVGNGFGYHNLAVPLVAELQQELPSGGFSRTSAHELWRDVRGGLLSLLWRQWQIIKNWVRANPNGVVLAVGDIVPLLLAWLSGARYAFVATAKSEYYWRDRQGKLHHTAVPFGGSIFYSWERWLMARRRCLLNLVRDQLTADHLNTNYSKHGLVVECLGNPMMDGLESTGIDFGIGAEQWVIAILPGSRPPEAYHNWQTLLVCAQVAMRVLPEPVHFLAAIAPSLDLEVLAKSLLQKGWVRCDPTTFVQPQARLHLVTDHFADCLQRSHLGLAMAGTATEQMVGLGKPVIAIAGDGPQFTRQFALEQSYLLGIGVNLIEKPAQTAEVIQRILQDGDYFQMLMKNAQERMGSAGASAKIAQRISLICKA